MKPRDALHCDKKGTFPSSTILHETNADTEDRRPTWISTGIFHSNVSSGTKVLIPSENLLKIVIFPDQYRILPFLNPSIRFRYTGSRFALMGKKIGFVPHASELCIWAKQSHRDIGWNQNVSPANGMHFQLRPRTVQPTTATNWDSPWFNMIHISRFFFDKSVTVYFVQMGQCEFQINDRHVSSTTHILRQASWISLRSECLTISYDFKLFSQLIWYKHSMYNTLG